ncbi:adenylyl-sulfate kinase [Candidatus Ishikawella capsulata]|uniref:Adenylyl-sulfate kinase n=1 Tax=Candidatus Ishikawaella capsulata Mpkobe TaxID=476281 RepID=C5WCC9_9ENTR|nr:adenylyl-sulfate kinase [Candidatus Ishikawaella capsulata]BAH82985.1 adenylylsulfate kinase [Candidatus Ishikawaella capsulata Mpkobe]
MINHNVTWHKYSINRNDREIQHKHPAVALWFTGLSGSGKSTIADYLENYLYHMGINTYLLDGDNLRHGLCCDLGFSDVHRKENIRRVGEVVKLMIDAGLIVLTAFIAPYRAERQMVKRLLGEEKFIEIFVDTPLEICEGRDPKGLYEKARRRKLNYFPGVNATYEVPQNPDIHLDGTQSVVTLTNQILALLRNRKIIIS